MYSRKSLDIDCLSFLLYNLLLHVSYLKDAKVCVHLFNWGASIILYSMSPSGFFDLLKKGSIRQRWSCFFVVVVVETHKWSIKYFSTTSLTWKRLFLGELIIGPTWLYLGEVAIVLKVGKTTKCLTCPSEIHYSLYQLLLILLRW